MSMSERPEDADAGRLVATGIPGLDDVLGGGLTADRVYLVEGNPGSGKTTLALAVPPRGRAARGETGLYVTLSETQAELDAVAKSHGWSLDGIAILELVAPEAELEPDNQYRDVPALRGRAGRDDQGDPRRGRADPSPGGSSSTRSRRCGCSPRTRSATAARSSP